MMETCKARRCNDEMHCHKCGYQWEVKDPEPPKCLTHVEVLRIKHNLKRRS